MKTKKKEKEFSEKLKQNQFFPFVEILRKTKNHFLTGSLPEPLLLPCTLIARSLLYRRVKVSSALLLSSQPYPPLSSSADH